MEPLADEAEALLSRRSHDQLATFCDMYCLSVPMPENVAKGEVRSSNHVLGSLGRELCLQHRKHLQVALTGWLIG